MNVIKKILTNILIYGTEFIVIMLSVFPIVWVALSSFKTNAQILEGPFTLPTGITTAKEAYTYLFQKYDFFSYFGNSLMKSAFMGVPKELDEAATIDGAGFFRTFFMINLPLAKSGLSTAGILMFLGNWNEYFYASLLTSSEKNRTLPVALQFFNQSLSYDYTKMFAALTLVVVPAIIVYCFAQEQVQESVAASGIKG